MSPPFPSTWLVFFGTTRRRRIASLMLIGLAVAILYVVSMAFLQSRGERFIQFSDLLIPRSLDVIVAAWLFYVGSSVGSFLNVVAWRMPRGVSINGRSHCPWCDHRLSWKDNCPVFGWLILAGRCRTCRMPIAPRYPIVELTVGLCLALVGWREFFGGGSTLPFHPERMGRVGALWTPYVSSETLVTMVYHVVVIASSWAFALVTWDGHRLPRTLVISSLLLVAIPILVHPGLAVVPWQVEMAPAWHSDGKYLDAAMRVLTGFVAAVLIARTMARHLAPTADPKLSPLGTDTRRLIDMIAIVAIPAIAVGWHASIGVSVLAIFIAAFLPSVLTRRIDPLASFAVALPVALTIQISFWRLLTDLAYWPSVGSRPMTILVWAALVLITPRILLKKHPAVEGTAAEAM